jgi:hypothetical protein
MSLFDPNPESIGTRAKKYAESTFEYYEHSARRDIAQIKTVLEDWFAHFPAASRRDLHQRFRSGSDRQHYGAFFELYTHELLLRLGYTAEVHPDVPERTHPDFLVSRDGLRRFFVESTIGTQSDEEAGQQRLMDQVYDTLDRLKSPDFLLALRVHGAPKTAPAGARLRRDLERWLQTLDWAAVKQDWDIGGFDALPTYPWEHEGWSVLIQPIPKSPETRGSADVRPVALNMPVTAFGITADDDVKWAVSLKNKYGDLDLPFLLAINVMAEFCDQYDVMNGLFGHETVIFGPGGTRPGGRLHDGAWDGPRGPRNTSISAVMVYRDLKPWNMKDAVSWFVHNPWASRPLASAALPFAQLVPNYDTGVLVQQDGNSPGSCLGLPEPWPPRE